MDPQLYAALLVLGLGLLTGFTGLVAWLFKQLPGWISRAVEARLHTIESGLAENTRLTEQARNASNGRLAAAINEAQKYRTIAERYKRLMQELNKIEAARPLMDQAAQAMRAVELDANWSAFEDRLMHKEEPRP